MPALVNTVARFFNMFVAIELATDIPYGLVDLLCGPLYATLPPEPARERPPDETDVKAQPVVCKRKQQETVKTSEDDDVP